MNTRKNMRWFSLILMLLTLSAILGYSVCYQDVTGVPITKLLTQFTQEKQESVGLSGNITVKTLEEARQVVEEAVKDRDYGPGYNCLDYVWSGMRALHWDGQPAAIVGLLYESGKGHTLILTAVKDKNWVFLDAQTGAEVYPIPGGYMGDEKIASIRILVLHWVELEDYLANPQREVWE